MSTERMRSSEEQLRPAQAEMRTLARTLLLEAPMRDLVSAFSVGSGPSVDPRVASGLPSLTPESAQAVLRVAQEAIHNAVRHAGAKAVWVNLAARGGRIELSVRDDGVGISKETPAGAGLRPMRTRASALGADLSVRSRSGGGTKVRLRVPVGIEGRVVG